MAGYSGSLEQHSGVLRASFDEMMSRPDFDQVLDRLSGLVKTAMSGEGRSVDSACSRILEYAGITITN